MEAFDVTRDNLMEDSLPLVRDINGGHTVVFVYGKTEFIESYYFKPKGSDLVMLVRVEHF